jgi:hypothetical protein
MAQVTAGLDQMGPACAAARLSASPVAPCTLDYQALVRTQVADLQAQMARLMVAPEAVGASACLPGATAWSVALAERAESDLEAEYDGLFADAAALGNQILERVLANLDMACALAVERRVSLPVCGPGTLADFTQRNATLAALSADLACVAGQGLVGGPAGCPRAPAANATSQLDALSYLDEYLGEVTAAGFRAQVIANGVNAGSMAFLLAGNAAALPSVAVPKSSTASTQPLTSAAPRTHSPVWSLLFTRAWLVP